MRRVAISFFVLTSALLFVTPSVMVAQEAPFEPVGQNWAARNVIYWGAPALAALLSWIVGIPWHWSLARKQYARWPGDGASGSFGSLCGGPLLFSVLLFLAVIGLFLYIYFGSPATLDEWQTHQKTAYWSLVISLIAAFAPWLTTQSAWRRA